MQFQSAIPTRAGALVELGRIIAIKLPTTEYFIREDIRRINFETRRKGQLAASLVLTS